MSKQGEFFRVADGTMRRSPALFGLLPELWPIAPVRPVELPCISTFDGQTREVLMEMPLLRSTGRVHVLAFRVKASSARVTLTATCGLFLYLHARWLLKIKDLTASPQNIKFLRRLTNILAGVFPFQVVAVWTINISHLTTVPKPSSHCFIARCFGWLEVQVCFSVSFGFSHFVCPPTRAFLCNIWDRVHGSGTVLLVAGCCLAKRNGANKPNGSGTS